MEILEKTLILDPSDIRRGGGFTLSENISTDNFNVDYKLFREMDNVVYISKEGYITVLKSRYSDFLTSLN